MDKRRMSSLEFLWLNGILIGGIFLIFILYQYLLIKKRIRTGRYKDIPPKKETLSHSG